MFPVNTSEDTPRKNPHFLHYDKKSLFTSKNGNSAKTISFRRQSLYMLSGIADLFSVFTTMQALGSGNLVVRAMYVASKEGATHLTYPPWHTDSLLA